MGAANTKELEDKMWSVGGGNGRKVEKPESPKKSKENLKEPTDDDLADAEDDDFDSYDPKSAGPIFPDGTINWDCPCLGGAAYGPCGTEFRQAFSCFHFSKEDPKGSDCFSHFREMHNCFTKYPDLYGPKEGEEDEDEDDDLFDDEELEVIQETDETEKTKEKIEEKDKQNEPQPTPVPKKAAEPAGSSEKKESGKKHREKEDVPRKNIPAIL